ncbi:MAG: polysaccharide biosynthesis protein [Clostridia bacterium]|nr:polysaccharide biosynthesis protein [Clostridia bacterium]
MSDSKTKQQSFLHGSFILIAATFAAKIISAIYRIPLTNILSGGGMGYFSTAYDLYTPMYSIAMAGLPTAISRMVAEYSAHGRYKDVKRTLHIAQTAFIFTGGIGFLLMLGLAFLLTSDLSITIFGHTLSFHAFSIGALPGMICIVPSLLFCCIMSAYRGYFEGLGNMTPTGVSEVFEAIGKLIFGLTIAAVILKFTDNRSYAAAGALLGITIGEAISTLYLFIKYKFFGEKSLPSKLYNAAPEPESKKKIFKTMVIIAIPIVLGSLVNNVTSLIDVAMVQKRLAVAINADPGYFTEHFKDLISYETAEMLKINESFNLEKDLPNALYGCHRGFAFSVYHLIPTLTTTLGISAIPVLARTWAKKDYKAVKFNIQTVIRTTAVIVIPCGLGMVAISNGILNLLYSNKSAIAIAVPNLRVLGFCAIFAGLNSPIIAMLQAVGKEVVPLKNVAVGAVIKVVTNYILVGNPKINIYGVPIGTTLCYLYIFAANLYCLIKYTGVGINIKSTLLKPFVAGALCAAAAYGSYRLIYRFVHRNIFATPGAIAVAAVVYLIAISLFRVLESEDILTLPKGDKILKICKKIKLVR